jgi:hypothetical protein
MFPSSDSLTQRPLRSPGSRLGRFPSFNATMRHSDSRPSCPWRFVFLRPTVTDPRVCLRSARPDAGRRPGALRLGSSTPTFTDQKRPGLPGSRRTLLCLCPALGPRQDRMHQARTVRRHGPRRFHSEGSHDYMFFGAQSHGFGTRCLRFAGRVAPPPRKTRFPLSATLCGAGLVTRRVLAKGFEMRPYILIPLSRALPGAGNHT